MGLGPLDVLVLFNAGDPDAVEVATHYADARSIPTAQRCGVDGVDPLARNVDVAGFEAIRAAFEACLAALPDPDGIDAIVTVRGLPYVVDLASGQVGFEAALQVGRGLDPSGAEIAGTPQTAQATVANPTYVGIGTVCVAADLTVENPYSYWYRSACALQDADRMPRGHRRAAAHEHLGWDLGGQLYVVGRLDGFDAADARDLVDRAIAADGTFPDAELLCMAGADEARAARDPECELATRRLAEAGARSTWLAPHDPALAGREVAAYFTGAADLTGAIDGLEYVPGAIACNLTSYGALPQNFFCDATGALCPEAEAQTSIARFVRAGATGVHGTVFEPLNNSFPDAGVILLYASGYTLGESFLFGQEFLYWANLVLGDPLTAPFAERPVVTVPAEAVEGSPLAVTASHPDGVAELRVYVDGAEVASAEGDLIEWDHGAAEGDLLELFVVAIAADAIVERPGWPVPDQRVQAETQGWTTATVPVGPAPSTTPTTASTPTTTTTTTGRCGCASGMGGGGAVPLLILVSRRRGSTSGSGSDPRSSSR